MKFKDLASALAKQEGKKHQAAKDSEGFMQLFLNEMKKRKR